MRCFWCSKKEHNLRECKKVPKKDKNTIFVKNIEDWKKVDDSDCRAPPKKGVVSVEASTAKDAEHEEVIDCAELRKLNKLRNGLSGIEVSDPGYYEKVIESVVPYEGLSFVAAEDVGDEEDWKVQGQGRSRPAVK